MRTVLKWGGMAIGVAIALVLIAAAYVQATWSADHPDTPLPPIAASTDPGVIAQGEYVVNALAHCSTCHAAADQVKSHTFDFSTPLEGGNVWSIPGFGVFTAANLTPHPTGIASMTDGEIARVVRSGIDREGKLSPMMRLAVGPMSDEDLTAVVSWLRSQQPVEGQRVGPRWGFLAKALSGQFTPRLDSAPAHVPAGGISIERGRYLANGPAFCAGCHTPTDPMSGFAPSGPALSGAAAPEPDGTDPAYEIVAPNLTPAPATGHITDWTEDAFVQRFRAGRTIQGSTMPWEAFGRMTEEDARSIYRYLRTLEPVERDVGPTRRLKGSHRG